MLSIADAAGNAAAAVALPAAGDAAGVMASGGRASLCFAIRARRAPDIIEAFLDKDTAEGAEKGASEAGRPLGAALELRGVQG